MGYSNWWYFRFSVDLRYILWGMLILQASTIIACITTIWICRGQLEARQAKSAISHQQLSNQGLAAMVVAAHDVITEQTNQIEALKTKYHQAYRPESQMQVCPANCDSGWLEYNQTCYFAPILQGKFEEVKDYCIGDKQGYVAYPRSLEEYTMLHSLAAGGGKTFLGLRRSSSGRWSNMVDGDSTTLLSNLWDRGSEGGEGRGSDSCACLKISRENNKLITCDCGEDSYFICAKQLKCV